MFSTPARNINLHLRKRHCHHLVVVIVNCKYNVLGGKHKAYFREWPFAGKTYFNSSQCHLETHPVEAQATETISFVNNLCFEKKGIGLKVEKHNVNSEKRDMNIKMQLWRGSSQPESLPFPSYPQHERSLYLLLPLATYPLPSFPPSPTTITSLSTTLYGGVRERI